MSDITSEDEKAYLDPKLKPKSIDHDSDERRKRTDAIKQKMKNYGMDYSWFPVIDLGRALAILAGTAPQHWTLYDDEIKQLEYIIRSFETTMNFNHTDPLPPKKDPDPS